MEQPVVIVERAGRVGRVTLNRPQALNALNDALMALKQCVNRAFKSSLTEGVLFERRELYARFATHDAREGVKAFLEKRQPVFAHS